MSMMRCSLLFDIADQPVFIWSFCGQPISQDCVANLSRKYVSFLINDYRLRLGFSTRQLKSDKDVAEDKHNK